MFRKRRQAAVRQLDLMIVGLRFVQAASWTESAEILRESPELLTDAGDAAMAALIERSRSEGNRQLLPVIEQHRAVLRACRENGITATLAALEAMYVPETEKVSLLRLAAEMLFVQLTADLRALIDQHEELVSPAGVATMRTLISDFRENADPADVAGAEARLELLERCVAVGVPAAFDELEARLAAAAAGAPAHVDEFTARSRAATAALSYCVDRDTLPDWDTCVSLFDDLVADLEARAGEVPTLVLFPAGLASMMKYRLSHDVADLDHAESRWAGLPLRYDIRDEDAGALLGGMADVYAERYRREGRADDRDKAIAALQQLLVSGVPPTTLRQAELAALLFDRHLTSADAEARLFAIELARAVGDGVAGRPEEEQGVLFRLPAALRTIIAGGTADEIADDISHGDQQVPADLAGPISALIDELEWRQAADLIAASPRLLDADTRRYLRSYATLADLAGEDTVATLARRRHDFLLACTGMGPAAAAERFTAEDGQMGVLVAGVHEATTPAELAGWCRAHPDVPARQALAELHRQAVAFHRAGEPRRHHDVARRLDILLSWREGDRLVPPGPGNAVRSATRRVAACLDTWEESGDPAVLAEAIELGERVRTERVPADADTADQASLLDHLARAYARRHHTRNHFDDLRVAVDRLAEAAEIAPEGSAARSTVLLNLAVTLRMVGEELSEPDKLRRAREILAELLAETDVADPDRSLVLWNLADALDDLASDEAEQDEAIAMAEHALTVTSMNSPYTPARIDGLGIMLRHRARRFRLASAVAASADLRRAATLERRAAALLADGSVDQAELLVHQANALMDLYQLTADEDAFSRAVAVFEQALACAGASPSLQANALAGRGEVFLLRHRRQRRPDDLRAACEMIEQSLAIDPRAGQGNRLLRLATLAMTMGAEGDPAGRDDAVTVLRDAIEAVGPGDPALPTARFQLARLLLARYEIDGSAADAEAVTALLVPAGEDQASASVLDLQGRLLLARYQREHDRHDLDAAIEQLSQAHRGMPQVLGVVTQLALAGAVADRYDLDHDDEDRVRASLDFRSVVRDAGQTDPGVAMAAALRWSTWALNRQAWPEAEAAAVGGMTAMQQLVQGQSRRHAKQDWIRNAQDLSVRAAVARHRRGDTSGAIVALEAGRALLLEESLDRTRLDLNSLTRDGHAEVAGRYTTAAQRWRDLIADPDPAAPADYLADAVAHARDELDAAIEAVRDIDGRYASFAAAPTIQDVVTASAGETIVYLSAAPPGGLALIVRADGQSVAIDLPKLTTAKLADVVTAWSTAYAQRHDNRAGWWRCVEFVTQWLWQAAMGGVLAALPGDEPLALVACGLLGVLPLHAATDEYGQAVTDRRPVRYVPNARALATAQDRAAASEHGSGLLAIQDPRSNDLPALPHAAAEVDAACARLAVGPVTRLPTPGTPANAALVLEAASRQRILHFCCHGAADPLDPLRSGLHLVDDERITAADIMARRIVSLLVVLSACESGIIGRDLPDEVIGLPTAFLEAGAAGVIGSLWSVTEAATVVVLDEFYRLWNSGTGMDAAAALAAAQSWARTATNEELHERFPGIGRFDPSAVPDAALRLWRAATPLSPPADWAALTYVGA